MPRHRIDLRTRIGVNVISYVPKGAWSTETPGIDVVNAEGTSITNTKVTTVTDVANSCASDSKTEVTVCSANNNPIYVVKGTGLDATVSANPLTDRATGDCSEELYPTRKVGR